MMEKTADKQPPAVKEYELIIPAWDAVIPKDWPMQLAKVSVGDGNVTKVGEFENVAGRTIHADTGTRIRGLPDQIADEMLEHRFIREVK